MKTGIVAYVNAIVAAGFLALLGLYFYGPIMDMKYFAGPCLLMLVAVAGVFGGYRIKGSTLGEVSFIPYLAAVVLFPAWQAVLVVGIGALFAELLRPKPAIKRAFNLGQVLLATSASVVVYTALGGVSLQIDRSFNPFAHSAAVSTFLLINTFAVAIAIGLAEKKSILKTWYTGNIAGLLFDVVAIFAVYIFAIVYVDWELWGVVVLGTLLVGIRMTYQSRHQLETTNSELLELFVQTVEFRDPYTSGHSQRVSRYSRIIAEMIGLGQRDIEKVSKAALLHDVGKIHEIFDPISSKPGRLTAEERAIMQLHPVKSAELVAKITDLVEIVPAVRHHHENWDGTGYPDQLSGRDIPLGARIIMFADTIDAMTTDRPYRKALCEADVVAEIKRHRGSQFDPDICDALLSSQYFHRLFDKNDTGRVHSLTQILEIVRLRRKTPAVA